MSPNRRRRSLRPEARRDRAGGRDDVRAAGQKFEIVAEPTATRDRAQAPHRRGSGPSRRSEESADLSVCEVAEGVGFEPTRRLPAYTRSRRAPSTTRPSLRAWKRRTIAAWMRVATRARAVPGGAHFTS